MRDPDDAHAGRHTRSRGGTCATAFPSTRPDNARRTRRRCTASCPPSSPQCRCAALHAVRACAHLYSSRATHACVKGCNSPVRAIRNCVLVAHGRFAIFERSRSDAANASATAIATTGDAARRRATTRRHPAIAHSRHQKRHCSKVPPADCARSGERDGRTTREAHDAHGAREMTRAPSRQQAARRKKACLAARRHARSAPSARRRRPTPPRGATPSRPHRAGSWRLR